MREVDLTPYGFPDAVVREDGTLLRKGRRVHPDFHGFVKTDGRRAKTTSH